MTSDGSRADEGFGYVQGVFTAFRLGNHEVVQVYAYDFRIPRIQSMLGAYENGISAVPLGLCDNTETECSLSGCLRVRISQRFGLLANRLYPKGEVDGYGCGGNHGSVHLGSVSKPHQSLRQISC